ncbi:tripartite tricarboxylate transporter substrate binding protein [Variovorax guangxiensis]|uniref:Bug family tripartite tricarboxylate transporter substrate binding protein n=1 Tax=Variovorax guangxiensis TaxID=1775474 RepID=UPI00285A2E90|nr:tripartite tricarboxylate transporter substrate binding protein [Variovorax guangxiensis]MDR6860966.1 tripartite-type tricarboxylate transporter receptor subunit TctC [Variovorax guangxiensis]
MAIQRRAIIARAAAAWAVATLQPWQAASAQQAWPSRTIKFVNMGPPGTAPDTYNRIYAEKLSKALNVPVIIENRPGVAGNIASDYVAKAPADGYTLLYTVSSSFTVNPWIYSKLKFDPEKELRPVSPLLSQGAFIVANNDMPFKTVKELVDYATAHPDKLAYGTNGVGSFLHLIMELFNQSAKVQMLHVPYKGPPLIEVVSGQIPLCVEPAASAIPMINAGKVRAIAYSGSHRHAQLPNVPTISETYPAVAVVGWHGVWAPIGVPNEVVQKLNAAVTRITQTPDVQKQIAETGSEPMSASVEAMSTLLSQEKQTWGDLVKARKITIE